MSDYIEKMGMAIVLNPVREPIDGYKTAKAAFDALMDAVPDLVWRSNANTASSGNYYIMKHEKQFLVLCEGETIGESYSMKLAKAAANAHHRAQVRAIWEGV